MADDDNIGSGRRLRYLYYVSIFAPVIYAVFDTAQKELRAFYARSFDTPVGVFYLSILAPILVSILLFVKIRLQKRMCSRLGRNLNIFAAVLLVGGAIAQYRAFGPLVLFVSMNKPDLSIVICLQVCSLVYDWHLSRNRDKA